MCATFGCVVGFSLILAFIFLCSARLTDDILEGAIFDVANEFAGACDDVTEMIFKSEFMKE